MSNLKSGSTYVVIKTEDLNLIMDSLQFAKKTLGDNIHNVQEQIIESVNQNEQYATKEISELIAKIRYYREAIQQIAVLSIDHRWSARVMRDFAISILERENQ